MTSECICKECSKEFDSRRSLHCHLKCHFNCIGDYYVKHYPKYDFLTKEQIPFLNYEQYLDTEFLSYENFKQWLKNNDHDSKKAYIKNKLIKKIQEKSIKTSPPDLFYELSQMANVDDYRSLYGSYSSFMDEIGLKKWFYKNLPNNFWENDNSDIEILIDTREQQPILFQHSIQSKLDFGDYTAGGELYSKTFIDRKSMGDFCSTFCGGIDRFRREMDRCVEFESYMFVVVESGIEKINNDNKKFVKNISYVWHNVKQLMIDYPENIQFIFAQSRKGAQKIIPRILFHGSKLWNVDVNYFLNKKIEQSKNGLV